MLDAFSWCSLTFAFPLSPRSEPSYTKHTAKKVSIASGVLFSLMCLTYFKQTSQSKYT